MFGMPCNHFFCRECYSDYLTVKVNFDGAAASVTCPSKGCGLLVDEVTALELLSKGETRDRYMNLVAKV